jgi:transposase
LGQVDKNFVPSEARASLRFSGKILSATVSRVANKWFVSIYVQMETTPVKVSENQADVIGVDLGVKNSATLSNRETIEGGKPLKKLGLKLARNEVYTRKGTELVQKNTDKKYV